jgi:uncharacterized protein
MRIAITGASGFVGRAVVAALQAAHHQVVRLVRSATGENGTSLWDPATGRIDATTLQGIDAVVHLAGENVAAGRWHARRKAAIAESRGPATLRLCQSLANLQPRLPIFVSASASGIYGDRGDAWLDEDAGRGSGFLADVAADWEAATEPLAAVGTRTVQLRIGIVLHPDGGALARMRLPFRAGLGGRLGHGRQRMSWITRADLVRIIAFALQCDDLRGPINATTPNPVTNAEFTRELGRALGRPTFLPAPAFALRLAFGEMAGMLLAGQRMRPNRLTAAGFAFEHPELGPALRDLLQAGAARTSGTGNR